MYIIIPVNPPTLQGNSNKINEKFRLFQMEIWISVKITVFSVKNTK